MPNDCFLGPLDNFQVITGSNGSGKVAIGIFKHVLTTILELNIHIFAPETVYIKQIALLVILAQIGCFVPAAHATIPLRDRILSRIG